MKQLFVGVITLLLLLACKENKPASSETTSITPQQPKENFTITHQSWGAINLTDSRAQLVEKVGETNLKDDKICGPECVEMLNVTIVFPGSEKETVVYWAEDKLHQKIASIATWNEQSPFHLENGIKIGATLNDLVAANNAKVEFWGFGWDYGGYISNWNKGAMEGSPFVIRLNTTNDVPTKLLGEKKLDSEMQEVKEHAIAIKVEKIILQPSL